KAFERNSGPTHMKFTSLTQKFFIAISAASITSAAWAAAGRVAIAEPGQLGMVEPASPVMQRLFQFHDYLLILITVVSLLVLALLVFVCWRYRASANPVPSK